MIEPDFHCHVCGIETDLAPNPPALAVCPNHCLDHEYINVIGIGFSCEHCGVLAPDDWRTD